MEKENVLHLVIGEEVSCNIIEEFSAVKLYVYDKDGSLKLYANFSLPYFINHIEFLDIENDPRYFFYEGYDLQSDSFKYRCEIKPFGPMNGIYRIIDGRKIKIGNIEPLCEFDNNTNVRRM